MVMHTYRINVIFSVAQVLLTDNFSRQPSEIPQLAKTMYHNCKSHKRRKRNEVSLNELSMTRNILSSQKGEATPRILQGWVIKEPQGNEEGVAMGEDAYGEGNAGEEAGEGEIIVPRSARAVQKKFSPRHETLWLHRCLLEVVKARRRQYNV